MTFSWCVCVCEREYMEKTHEKKLEIARSCARKHAH